MLRFGVESLKVEKVNSDGDRVEEVQEAEVIRLLNISANLFSFCDLLQDIRN